MCDASGIVLIDYNRTTIALKQFETIARGFVIRAFEAGILTTKRDPLLNLGD